MTLLQACHLSVNRQKSKILNISDSKILLCSPVNFDEEYLIPLSGTEKEVNSIAKLFSTNAKVLMKKEAKETTIKAKDLKAYNFIHFSRHGMVNGNNPELSAIYLRKDQSNDSILYTGEIYGLTLNVDLVSLPAYQTGLSKIKKAKVS